MKINSQIIGPTKNAITDFHKKTKSQQIPMLNFKHQDRLSEVLDRNIDNILQKKGFSLFSKLKLKFLLDTVLPEITTSEKYINNGRNSTVYKLSNKYVLKINNDYKKKPFDFLNYFKPSNKKFKNINCYYGMPLINFGGIQILRNADDGSLFKTCGLPYSNKQPEQEEIIQYENEFIPYLASIPQESFNELAYNINEINNVTSGKKTYYLLDSMNPNNILISNNHFRIVDELTETSTENPNDFLAFVEPLLLRYSTTYCPDYKKDLVDLRKAILKKCFIAAEQTSLPYENKYSQNDTFLWDLLQKITKFQTNDLINVLKNMRNSNLPLQIRIELINDAFKTI